MRWNGGNREKSYRGIIEPDPSLAPHDCRIASSSSRNFRCISSICVSSVSGGPDPSYACGLPVIQQTPDRRAVMVLIQSRQRLGVPCDISTAQDASDLPYCADA